jgi:hypothetical protein
MSLMIAGPDIPDVFSLLHDGRVVRAELRGDNLQFEVEIRYLAELVRPTFEKFAVTVFGVRAVSFVTWPNDATAPAGTLTSATEIFQAPLQILSGESEGGRVRVVCNQPSSAFEYCGGDLYFQAEGAVVRDEAGTEYPIEGLRALAQTYWSRWSERNESLKRGAT